MNDNLDNDFKNRIREVFDNYEDTSAEEGWQLLRQRFPEQSEKVRPIARWWYSAAAAIVLVCLGVWLLRPQQVINNHQNISKNQPRNNSENNKEDSPVDSQSANDGTNEDHNDLSKNQRIADGSAGQYQPVITNKNNDHQPERVTFNTESSATNNSGTEQIAAGVNPTQKSNTGNNSIAPTAGNYLSQSKTTEQQASVKEDDLGNDKAKLNKEPENKIASADVKEKDSQKQSVVLQPQGDAVLRMMASDKAKEKASGKDKNTSEVIKQKSVVLGVYAATYVNYAKGSDNAVNVGAGFSSDFKLTNRLKFSTGVAIAQNSLNYNSSENIPQQATARTMSSAVASNAPQMFFSSKVATPVPVVKNYNASLIGIDVPLNLKYQFGKNGDTFVSAGISSGTFIDEKYSSAYSYTNNYNPYSFTNSATANNVSEVEQQTTTRQHFSTFDFAKTLNFSFGMGYPLGKRNRLVIEPFVKYPLGGVGQQDLRFGAGGVNLKLNFQSSKK